MAEDDNSSDIQSLKERIALQEVEIGLLREKKEFLEDDEAMQESRLALAKKRLEELRKEAQAIGDINKLSNDEKESLAMRLQMLQQGVVLENKRLESIQASQQASENLSNITGNYFSQITMINDGWKETALGGLLQASMTARGLEGSFKKMGEAIKNLPMNVFANILGEIEQQTVQMFKTIMSSNAEMVKATGLIDQNFGQQIQDLGGDFTHMALGVDEARESIHSLYTGFSNFRNLDKSARESLKKTTMTLKGLGIDGGTSVKFMDDAMKTFGLSTQEAEKAAMRFVGAARKMKQTADQLMDAMAPFAGELAAFKDGITTFLALAEAADKAGQSVDELVKVSRQFDTFKGAASAVHKLNLALGQNVLDMQTMMSLQPEERVEKIREAMQNSGKDFENMGHMQKKFFAGAAGFSDVGEMMKFVRNETEKGADKFKEYGMTQEEIEEIAKKSKTAIQVMEAALQKLAMSVAPVVTALSDVAGLIADFLSGPSGEIIMWAVLLSVAFVYIVKAFTALKAAWAGAKLLLGASAAASATAQATANGVLAASFVKLAAAATAAAGPMGAMTAVSTPFLVLIGIIAIAIAVIVYALIDFGKAALEGGAGLGELVLAFAALGAVLAVLGMIWPLVVAGALAMGAAFIIMGIGMAFVSTKDLQAIATIFASITNATKGNPFSGWISGIGAFASKAASVSETIKSFGAAMNTFRSSASSIQPITTLVTAISAIDDSSVRGLAEAKTLVQELRVAVDNDSTEALNNLVQAFTSAARGQATQAGSGKGGDIVLELDGTVVGKFVAKTMKAQLKTSAFRT